MASPTDLESRITNAIQSGMDDSPEKDHKELSGTDHDPFGDEEEGEVKYRTMSWW